MFIASMLRPANALQRSAMCEIGFFANLPRMTRIRSQIYMALLRSAEPIFATASRLSCSEIVSHR